MNAQANIAIFPLAMMLLIGLAVLAAITIVVISLVKAGKGGGVAVIMIALVLGGIFLIGLIVPVYVARSTMVYPQPPQVVPPPVRAPMQHWELHTEDSPTQLLPLHVESQTVVTSPAPPPVVITTPAPPAPAPEISSEAEMEATASSSSEAPAVPATEAAGEPASATQAEVASTPGERPAWIATPQLPTRDIAYRTVLQVGPYSTAAEIGQELMNQVNDTLINYMETQIGHGAAHMIDLPPGYVVDHGLIAERWSETIDSPTVGPMQNLHVQFQISREVRDDLAARYEQARVTTRLGAFGLGGGLLLALLGTLYGYLRLDTLTQGYYTGRLRLAAVLAGLSAAGAAFGLVAERVVMWV